MKATFIFGILLISYAACNNKPSEKKSLAENQNQEIKITKGEKANEKSIKKDIEQALSIKYQSQTKKFYSDTLYYLDFQYLVYGELHETELSKSTALITIDSINLITPKKSTLQAEGLGGYLYKKNNYSFDDLIKFNDVNGDTLRDLVVFNWMRSGASGPAVYNIFKNLNGQFSFFKISTDPNIFIDLK